MNQQRAVGAQHGVGFRAQLRDGAAFAQEGIDPPPPSGRLRVGHDLLPVALILDRAPDDDEQSVELHRLGEELFGAELDGLDGRIDRGKCGQNDQRGIVDGPEFRNEIERSSVRKAIIQNRHIGAKRAKLDAGRGAIVRFLDVESV